MCQEMETLLDRKGDYHSYIPPVVRIILITNQVVACSSFQADGIPPRVSLGNQVQKGYKQQISGYSP